MTYVLAALILLSFPIFMALLKRFPHRRSWAYVAIGTLPMLTNLPFVGFIYGWPSWNGTSRGLSVSLLVMIAIALIATRPRMNGKLPFWGLFGLYGLALLISIFSTTVWFATVFAWWQFASLLIVFAAVGGEGDKPRIRSAILTGFALGLMYQAGYSISQKLSGATQAAGTFGHQNILGLALELAVLPLVAAALGGDRSKIIVTGIGAALISTAFSGSRATVGIVFASIAVLALLSLARRPTPRKFTLVMLGAVAFMGATPLALATLNNRFQGGSLLVADEERVKFEQSARSMADNHPFGVGANQFVFVSNRDGYADRAGIPWQRADRSVPVHNAYLLARAETGWLGEFAFILILVVPMVMALLLSFRDRKHPGGEILLGCTVGLIANMAHNSYEFAVHSFAIQALLLINIGLIASELRSRKAAVRLARLQANFRIAQGATARATQKPEPSSL
ncbi:hypothetical protein ATE67_15745 [Sphingopyxis sp. H050]|jgi:O-Antigen ligase|uniref:O-antigen ligase family protein n=1 Tax=Sphingopyxis sp. H050 TaxID=1759072 RepID=UPI00073630EA|nr:O-antigen ligase family protein [Sphingopyxis sp. H050]KTE18996.1 hypothetical protein ATE67_15745 [Sphingopyxis sp. H050]